MNKIGKIDIQNYDEKISRKQNDLSSFVNCLAIFNEPDQQIYKISAIDYRANRFEANGATITRWLTFNTAKLFDFTNEELFEEYYNLYAERRQDECAVVRTREDIFEWLARNQNRIGIQKEQ